MGSLKGEIQDFIREGIDDIVITNYLSLSFDELKPRAKEDMAYTFSLFVKKIKTYER